MENVFQITVTQSFEGYYDSYDTDHAVISDELFSTEDQARAWMLHLDHVLQEKAISADTSKENHWMYTLKYEYGEFSEVDVELHEKTIYDSALDLEWEKLTQ